MIFKTILKCSTSLIVCTSIITTFVYAKDRILQPQTNTPNNKVGLDINKTVATQIDNAAIDTTLSFKPALTLPPNTSILFQTGDDDKNNTNINLYYNKDAITDNLGNSLDADTFYFTNSHEGNNYKFIGNIKATGKLSAPVVEVNGRSLEDTIDKANNAVTRSEIDVANGVAGLNANKQITANVNNSDIKTDALQLNQKNDRLRFVTQSSDTNNGVIDMFYNRDSDNKDDFGNPLDANTFYFTNNRYGNNFKFNGNVSTTGNLKTNNLHITLSTPSSSSATCTAGDIKDDANYHYVCVSANKWKRVALSDF